MDTPADLQGPLLEFSPDGKALILPVLAGGRIHIGRWDAATGRAIRSLPSAQIARAIAFESPDSRWIVSRHVREESRAPGLMQKLFNKYIRRWDGTLSPMYEWYEVTDAETGRSQGFVDLEPNSGVLPAGEGFVAWEPTRMRYYGYPVRRNRWWLARWMLGPLAAFAVIRALWVRRKRRITLRDFTATDLTSSSSPAPQPPSGTAPSQQQTLPA